MPKVGSSSLFRLALRCAATIPLFICVSWSVAQTHSNAAGFESLVVKADAARDAGQIDEAIHDYRAALDIRPSWDEGWWYLGTILYDADRFDEAVPALRKVVALQPKAGPAWAFLGLSEFETGDYRGSFSALQKARELGFVESPDVEKVALYHFGLLLNLQGKFEQATEVLVSAFGPNHFTDQIRVSLGLAFLRVPILPSQADPAKDALVHAAGEAAVLLADHQTEAGARSMEQMLRDYPDTPYLHYQYGLMLAASAQYPQAETHLREETRITPRSALVYDALANVLRAQKKQEEAATASQRAHELAKQAVEADGAQVARYALSRSAIKENSKSTAPAASGSFEELARLADSERRAGRLEQAATAYRSALALRPTWPEGWRQVGTIEYMQAQHAEAVSALQQAVALDARLPDAWTLLGLSEFETRDYKNSLVHLERARTFGFTGNAAAVRIARYHLALLLNRTGEFDRALDLLVPEIAPGGLQDEIQFAMGIALLRIPALPEQVKPEQKELVRKAGEAASFLSDSHYEKAFPIIETLLKEYPTTLFLHYAYGDALAATSMYDEAQVQLREETRLNPDNALSYIRLASIELQQHHSANALADAKKAVALAPESSEARYLLGRSFLDERDIPAAIRELETARRYSPNSPRVHFNLARAYAKAGRASEAQESRAEFERLNALLPGQLKSYGDRVARSVTDEKAGSEAQK